MIKHAKDKQLIQAFEQHEQRTRSLLEKTLEEEKQTDQLLASISRQVNLQAAPASA